jgi:hypothetical protein
MLQMALRLLMPSKKSLLVVSYNFSQVGYSARFRLSAISTQCVLGLHGGDRKSEKAKDQDRNPTLIGRGRDYDIARLERDRPDLAARVRANELSANAAAIEAGFRKKPTKGAQTPV